MSLAPGVRLGHYEVLGSLGAGGRDEVYRASDTTLGREVALKLLPEALAADAERLGRFEREAKRLASLDHPNIAQVYGFETATLPDGATAHFLATELLEGEDLAERLSRGPLPPAEVWPLARQIAEALECAHGKGIVHRGLKPANVRLTPDGTVKVLDFALAKAWSADDDPLSGGAPGLSPFPALAHTGADGGPILGAAAYTAPEQVRGRPVDKRADIWAFGVLLFEMLSGRPLFAGETISDVLAAVLKDAPRWEELPPGLPAGVRRVLARCLARDPGERLHDIADARLELQDAAAELTPSADGDAAPRKNLRALLVGSLLVLGGLAGGVGLSWLRTPSAIRTPLRFTLTPPGSGGRITSVRLFPDGRRILYSLSSEPRLLVHDLGQFDSRPIAGTEGAVYPFASADGRSIGFIQQGKLRRIGLEGGDPSVICNVPGDTPGATWGPRDVILFSPGSTNVGLWRVDATGGAPVELTKPDRAKGEAGHSRAAFLPDGRAALFTIFAGRGLADSRVGLVDLESRRYEALFDGAAPVYLDSGHVLYYRGGGYRVVPFDAARRRVSGPETTVMTQVRRLSPAGNAENYLSFARDGLLAYVEGASTLEAPLSRLAWVARDGRPRELPFEACHFDLSLSPDATRAAVTRVDHGEQQVYAYNLERATSEQLTRDGQNWDPAWHPDGRRLAVTTQIKGNLDVRRLPADGSSPPEALLATEVDETRWRWAPDGASAVFEVYSPLSGKDVWRAKGDGSAPAPLLASDAPEEDASVSRDGRWLAFRAGGALYVAGYPSLGQRVLIAAAAGAPRWSRSTPELFYIDDGRLKAVSYQVRDGVFRPSPPTTLFALGRLLPRYDVAPDGRFLFLAASPGQPERDVIRVVLDGFAELRK